MERDSKVRMTGGFVTQALRIAYSEGGLAEARKLVLEGLTDEQLRDICEGAKRLEGSSTTEFTLEDEPSIRDANKPV